MTKLIFLFVSFGIVILPAFVQAQAPGKIWDREILAQPFDKEPFRQIAIPDWLQDTLGCGYTLSVMNSEQRVEAAAHAVAISEMGFVDPFFTYYIWACTNHRVAFSEPYILSHGNPYGKDSFPPSEILRRMLLAATYGASPSIAVIQPPHLQQELYTCMDELQRRKEWLIRKQPEPWAALVMSDNTRNFYGRSAGQVEERYLASVFGTFRAAVEEHLPLTVINDWNLTTEDLSRYKVLVLANTACLDERQVAAVKEFVSNGGGLVASLDTSLFDEFGKGRVVYFAAGLDAAYYLYSYPYQRLALKHAIIWAANESPPIQITAPMCVHSTLMRQTRDHGDHLIVHLYNDLNTTAHHALPIDDVPLREETVPIHNIQVTIDARYSVKRVLQQPEGIELTVARTANGVSVTVPELDIHTMAVVELER